MEGKGGRLETEPACLVSLVPNSLDGPSPTPLLEAEPLPGRPRWWEKLLPTSCAHSGAAGLDRKGNIGSATLRSLHCPAQRAEGQQEVRAAWGSVPDSGENRLAAGQTFYSTEGNHPSQTGEALVKACTLEGSSVPLVERLRVHLRSPCITPRGVGPPVCGAGEKRPGALAQPAAGRAMTLAGCVPSLHLIFFSL